MITDWNDIRAVRYSPMTPPPEWPPNVRPISTEGVSLLGIDPATNQLYWDGKQVVLRSADYVLTGNTPVGYSCNKPVRERSPGRFALRYGLQT
jgi:hypothetical protein